MNRNRPLNDPASHPQSVADVVSGFIRHHDFFLELARMYGSPLYIIDEAALLARIEQFISAFKAHLPDIHLYFPVKTNSHPALLQAMTRGGIGLEVSSGLELELAIASGSRAILFNGPAKSDEELKLALRHHRLVTVIIDSAAEFGRLLSLAPAEGVCIRAGIRLSVSPRGLWRKFGIQPEELRGIMELAADSSHIVIAGLHFHTSWNMDPSAQVDAIAMIGRALETLSREMLERLEFIDIGGGFWPPQGEWIPTVPPQERIKGENLSAGPFHRTVPAAPISEFALQISRALATHIFPRRKLTLYAEPGRWLCNDAMHLLLRVVDIKGGDMAITDAGTNAIGWERFESEYFPIINLTQPDGTELPFLILGSLCTPHDIWGCSCFGKGVAPGDLLLIPMQGAYSYSLRQQFIKPLPRTLFVPFLSDRPMEIS